MYRFRKTTIHTQIETWNKIVECIEVEHKYIVLYCVGYKWHAWCMRYLASQVNEGHTIFGIKAFSNLYAIAYVLYNHYAYIFFLLSTIHPLDSLSPSQLLRSFYFVLCWRIVSIYPSFQSFKSCFIGVRRKLLFHFVLFSIYWVITSHNFWA